MLLPNAYMDEYSPTLNPFLNQLDAPRPPRPSEPQNSGPTQAPRQPWWGNLFGRGYESVSDYEFQGMLHNRPIEVQRDPSNTRSPDPSQPWWQNLFGRAYEDVSDYEFEGMLHNRPIEVVRDPENSSTPLGSWIRSFFNGAYEEVSEHEFQGMLHHRPIETQSITTSEFQELVSAGPNTPSSESIHNPPQNRRFWFVPNAFDEVSEAEFEALNNLENPFSGIDNEIKNHRSFRSQVHDATFSYITRHLEFIKSMTWIRDIYEKRRPSGQSLKGNEWQVIHKRAEKGLALGNSLRCFFPTFIDNPYTAQMANFDALIHEPKRIPLHRKEIPNASLFVLNGINTPLSKHHKSILNLSNQIGDYDIKGLYNPSYSAVLDIARSGGDLVGSYSETVNFTAQSIMDEIHNHPPDHKIYMICHSQGGIVLRNALEKIPIELRAQVHVLAIAPAASVCVEGLGSIEQYMSRRDFVSFFDYRALMRPEANFKILEAAENAPFWDHDFNSPTFENVKKRFMDRAIGK